MATSTTSYFSKAVVGVPRVGGDVDIYDVHTNPKFAIGTKFERADGAIFRYAHFGAVTSAGNLCSTDVSESSLAYTANSLLAPAAYLQQPQEQVGLYPGAKGSKYVVMTLASVTKNQYQGAIVTMANNTGAGFSYLIVGMTSTGVYSSGVSLIELADPLQVAIDATTDVIIAGNKYSNLEGAAYGSDPVAAGVTMANVNAAGSYGWVQTKGICGIINDTFIISTGNMVTVSTTAGYCSSVARLSTTAVSSIGTLPFVGYCASNGSASAMVAVNLQLD